MNEETKEYTRPKRRTASRMIAMLAIVGVLVGAIGFVKFRQIQVAIAQGASWSPPPESVTSIVARQEEWPVTLSAIGSVEAVHGVVVSADLPGIVDRIDFESGQRVEQGAELVRLESSQERAQLASGEARLELAKINLDRGRQLIDKQLIAQSEFDQTSAAYKEAEAAVGEIQAVIARKTIRAPFSGAVGIRQVNLGQYLAGGAPVAPLQSMDPIYVNFGVPQQQVSALTRGDRVVVADSTAQLHSEGRITAINSVIDEATRNIQVQGTFPNPGGRLKPGMYVDVQVMLGEHTSVVALPATAISYAPYGNSVFIITELKDPKGKAYRGVRQEFVKLGGSRGDQVAVLSGVKPGEEVVTSGVFKLRNGASVVINNAIQPSNNPAPRPEDS